MKALVGAFNQEKALVGAFSVITNLRMKLFEALLLTGYYDAFAAAVAHVTSAAAARAVFSREQFAREVRRLAVHCGVATLHHKLGDSPDIPEEEVIALFTDVRKLCETSI